MNLINIDEPNKKSFTSKCLGIDFGTTNSVCSVKINEKIIYIEDSKKKLIPSIVFFENQEVFIGNQITEVDVTYPKLTILLAEVISILPIILSIGIIGKIIS